MGQMSVDEQERFMVTALQILIHQVNMGILTQRDLDQYLEHFRRTAAPSLSEVRVQQLRAEHATHLIKIVQFCDFILRDK